MAVKGRALQDEVNDGGRRRVPVWCVLQHGDKNVNFVDRVSTFVFWARALFLLTHWEGLDKIVDG